MPRENILFTVLQYHTPKMCFPSLPIRSFMERVSRIIPVSVFFPGGLSFSCVVSQLEKLASGSQKGMCGDFKKYLRAEGRRAVALLWHCFHTPQPYYLQLKCPHCATPPVCTVRTVLSCNHTLPYQVIWYSVSLHLISSRPALGAIVAVWQRSMKKKKVKTL